MNECASKQSCLHTEHIAVVPPYEATPVPTASVSDSAVIQNFSFEVDNSHSSSTFIANQKQKTERPAEFRKEPSQPRDVVAVQVKTGRKFRTDWYSKYAWLEWNYELQAAVCHPCRQITEFDKVAISKSEIAFTSAGFSNWKKAIERFDKHERSSSHRVNIGKFEAIVRGENVHAQIDSQDKKERIIAQ